MHEVTGNIFDLFVVAGIRNLCEIEALGYPSLDLRSVGETCVNPHINCQEPIANHTDANISAK